MGVIADDGEGDLGFVRANDMKGDYPSGRPLLPTEMREATQHGTVKNGGRFCWGHSALSGCGEGNKCSVNPSMMGMENLRCLIRAQSARRGWRKGRNRTPPESADGYILALRHANSPNADCDRLS